MSNDTARSSRSYRTRNTIGSTVRTVLRLVGDLLVVSLWVLFLTLLFLENTWPRWAFYTLLLGGVAVYVAVTAAWTGGRSGSESERERGTADGDGAENEN
ncbi:hypothetical protein [Natrinema salifodinae]|uniref:DUF8119 domain-containing protein n=1 Tax=Natrinema salifodinae TaxID=1202768 RepID=A0A1I0NG54_9EURY|nr:hypothetical protein [Natrinema salifodinae]SEW00366.1 hypothetical protein SAMN05216285_1696 [Natrinema salifodinae]